MTKPIIKVTNAAKYKLLDIIKESNAKALFFYLKSGGCNGFEYQFKTITNINNNNNLYKDDTLKIEVCNKSLMFLIGTEIDWKKDIMGESFKFNNPLSYQQCGCGTSFTPYNLK